MAGLAAHRGSNDGVGSAARFSNPESVAVDSVGNIYVADTYNFTIRKVTNDGTVSTLAGKADPNPGHSDGTGSAARFNYPQGVAVDSSSNVYVADYQNCTIRKITPAGVVSTFAGLATQNGYADGTGSAARFAFPAGVAVDSIGNVYVADDSNSLIRKITPAAVVSTLAGSYPAMAALTVWAVQRNSIFLGAWLWITRVTSMWQIAQTLPFGRSRPREL